MLYLYILCTITGPVLIPVCLCHFHLIIRNLALHCTPLHSITQPQPQSTAGTHTSAVSPSRSTVNQEATLSALDHADGALHVASRLRSCTRDGGPIAGARGEWHKWIHQQRHFEPAVAVASPARHLVGRRRSHNHSVPGFDTRREPRGITTGAGKPRQSIIKVKRSRDDSAMPTLRPRGPGRLVHPEGGAGRGRQQHTARPFEWQRHPRPPGQISPHL